MVIDDFFLLLLLIFFFFCPLVICLTSARFLLVVWLWIMNLTLQLILLYLNCLVDTSLTGGWLLHLAKNLGNVSGFISR